MRCWTIIYIFKPCRYHTARWIAQGDGPNHSFTSHHCHRRIDSLLGCIKHHNPPRDRVMDKRSLKSAKLLRHYLVIITLLRLRYRFCAAQRRRTTAMCSHKIRGLQRFSKSIRRCWCFMCEKNRSGQKLYAASSRWLHCAMCVGDVHSVR